MPVKWFPRLSSPFSSSASLVFLIAFFLAGTAVAFGADPVGKDEGVNGNFTEDGPGDFDIDDVNDVGTDKLSVFNESVKVSVGGVASFAVRCNLLQAALLSFQPEEDLEDEVVRDDVDTDEPYQIFCGSKCCSTNKPLLERPCNRWTVRNVKSDTQIWQLVNVTTDDAGRYSIRCPPAVNESLHAFELNITLLDEDDDDDDDDDDVDAFEGLNTSTVPLIQTGMPTNGTEIARAANMTNPSPLNEYNDNGTKAGQITSMLPTTQIWRPTNGTEMARASNMTNPTPMNEYNGPRKIVADESLAADCSDGARFEVDLPNGLKRREVDGRFRVVFEHDDASAPKTVSVRCVDEQNNVVTDVATFEYKPRNVAVRVTKVFDSNEPCGSYFLAECDVDARPSAAFEWRLVNLTESENALDKCNDGEVGGTTFRLPYRLGLNGNLRCIARNDHGSDVGLGEITSFKPDGTDTTTCVTVVILLLVLLLVAILAALALRRYATRRQRGRGAISAKYHLDGGQSGKKRLSDICEENRRDCRV